MGTITICGVSALDFTVRCGNTEAELYAAELLKKYLEKSAGTPMRGGDGLIELRIDPTGLGAEGYRIRCAAGRLEIIGADSRGVVYGVYGLLEKYLGFRCFAPGVERIGGGDIPETDESFTPIFEYRQSDWPALRDPDWCAANRINNYALTAGKYGGYVKWGSFVHTMTAITGVAPTEQPCLTDPEVLRQAIAYVRGILEKDPDVRIISVSQNDNQHYCTCPRCAAIDEEEGSHMGSLLRLVNAVAADIREDYPDVAIETLAYQYTRKAPKITRPLPNVIIRLCSIECCFSHPLADISCVKNESFTRDIEAWSAICRRLYIWDYVTNFAYYVPTFPNFGVLRDNMRFYALHGVKGMYPEGNFQAESGEFAELRGYLLARLMWDPLMSEVEYQRHMDEFLEAYYGAGWRNIRAYIDLTCSAARRSHMRIYDNPLSFLSKETVETIYDAAETWWDRAEAEAGDRIEAVRRSRLQWTYLALCVRPDPDLARQFYHEVNRRGIRWRESMCFLPDEQDYTLTPAEWKYR